MLVFVMTPLLRVYVVCWAAFCVLAVAILVHDRRRLLPEWRAYLRFLLLPWKVALFVPAWLFVTFAGRFTDDETWDVVTGSGMSILTYLTAAWAVGLFWQVREGRRPARYLVVALALSLFSSSWFYDGYLLWRDGAYTSRWWSNLVLSSIIYLSAGLLWNLEVKPGGGVTLAFLRESWPTPPADRGFRSLILVAIPLILIAAFLLVAFVGWRF
jgi:hypothetical protein